MNKLTGHIANIKTSGNLSLVSVDITEQLTLQAIVIDTPKTASYLVKGNPVKVLFKETEVIIGTNKDHAVSLQNRISGVIKLVERGEMLSKLVIQTETDDIVSIISTNAVETLYLENNTDIIAMIKLNEIILSE